MYVGENNFSLVFTVLIHKRQFQYSMHVHTQI